MAMSGRGVWGLCLSETSGLGGSPCRTTPVNPIIARTPEAEGFTVSQLPRAAA